MEIGVFGLVLGEREAHPIECGVGRGEDPRAENASECFGVGRGFELFDHRRRRFVRHFVCSQERALRLFHERIRAPVAIEAARWCAVFGEEEWRGETEVSERRRVAKAGRRERCTPGGNDEVAVVGRVCGGSGVAGRARHLAGCGEGRVVEDLFIQRRRGTEFGVRRIVAVSAATAGAKQHDQDGDEWRAQG